MVNIKFAIEYLMKITHKMIEDNNNYAVQSVRLAIEVLQLQVKIQNILSEIDRKHDNYDVMLIKEVKDILNELIID